MSTAPRIDIDPAAFWADPYPMLAKMRREAPIAFVPQLGSTLLTSRDDISISEKQIDVFSSHQPAGLMNRLMGHNMMRKDGEAHQVERRAMFPTVSPKTVKGYWTALFQAHADRILDSIGSGRIDFMRDFALPFSGECLKSITGLTNIGFEDMDAWSQGMIEGIANYAGDPAVEARCHAATSGIDAAIDDILPAMRKKPDQSILGVLLASGMAMDSVRANVKLAISGGQNEPRKAIAGTVWALLSHPEQLELVRRGEVSWLEAFEEYARWISPIGMSPRLTRSSCSGWVSSAHIVPAIALRGSFCPPEIASLTLARTLSIGMPEARRTPRMLWSGCLRSTGRMSSIAASIPDVAAWQRASTSGSPA